MYNPEDLATLHLQIFSSSQNGELHCVMSLRHGELMRELGKNIV
jgi:hypothetical protein